VCADNSGGNGSVGGGSPDISRKKPRTKTGKVVTRNGRPSGDRGGALCRVVGGAVMTGAQMIARERTRQHRQEGWTAKHDNGHVHHELVRAAVCYALPEQVREQRVLTQTLFWHLWPWGSRYWKPTPDDRIRELVKAGALIAAEIDRLHRLIAPPPESEEGGER